VSKTNRRILFWGFFATFLVSAPLLILYSAGYRLDLVNLRVYKTGLLVLQTNDRHIRTLFDGIPTRGLWRDDRLWFSQLLPGTISVRVEKTGFLPWEKEYRIEAGLTTFTSPVLLLRHRLPRKIAQGVYTFLPIKHLNDPVLLTQLNSKNEQKLWSFNSEELTATTKQEYARTIPPVKFEKTIEKLPKGQWDLLPSPKRFLTAIERTTRILVVLDKERSTQFSRGPIHDARWNSNSLLAVLENKQLHLWDVDAGTTQTTALLVAAKYVAVPNRLPIVLLADLQRVRALERTDANPFEVSLLELKEIRDMRLVPDNKTLVVLGSDQDGPGVFLYDLP